MRPLTMPCQCDRLLEASQALVEEYLQKMPEYVAYRECLDAAIAGDMEALSEVQSKAKTLLGAYPEAMRRVCDEVDRLIE